MARILRHFGLGYHGPAGSMKSTAGQGACTPCGTGSFSAPTGSTSCTQCPAGYHQDQIGQTSCKKCAAGYFQDRLNQASCKKYSAGAFTSWPGSTSCTRADTSRDIQYSNLKYHVTGPGAGKIEHLQKCTRVVVAFTAMQGDCSRTRCAVKYVTTREPSVGKGQTRRHAMGFRHQVGDSNPAWVNMNFGQCGVSPTYLDLPTHVPQGKNLQDVTFGIDYPETVIIMHGSCSDDSHRASTWNSFRSHPKNGSPPGNLFSRGPQDIDGVSPTAWKLPTHMPGAASIDHRRRSFTATY